MTPISLRPSLDADRTYLTVGGFQNAYLTEHTAQRIQALHRDLGTPIELVVMYDRRSAVRAEDSGAEVSEE